MNKIKRFIQNIRFLLNFNLADEELQVRGLVKDTRNDIQRIEKKMWRTVSRLRDDMERGQSNISKAIRNIEKSKDKD